MVVDPRDITLLNYLLFPQWNISYIISCLGDVTRNGAKLANERVERVTQYSDLNVI